MPALLDRRHRPTVIILVVLLVLALGVVSTATARADRATGDTLNGHAVMVDDGGRLVSWVPQADRAYAQVSALAWTYLLTQVPDDDENGQPAYLSHSYLDPNSQRPVGWPHNPAGLYAMLVESAADYYQFSGDTRVLTLAQRVVDQQLAHGLTAAGDSWSRVPYASGDSGSLTYDGASYGDVSGAGDGKGVIQPDKVGELGHALVQLYKITGKRVYLDAAIISADALVSHVRTGTETQSPWPFRVVARTNQVKEQYSSSVTGSLELFDDLIGLGQDTTGGYQRTRASVWAWTMRYPMQNMNWSGYFEDVELKNRPDENLNQLNAMMFARYLLEHPQTDSDWLTHVRSLITWVEQNFAITGDAGQYGATTIREQQAFPYRMGSHTARYAMVNALLYEKTGDTVAREKAVRSFAWATYMTRPNGVVIDGPEVNNQWFTDGYGDYVRHFMIGMAAMPAYAPNGQNHLLATTSVVSSVTYGTTALDYRSFDATGTERIKLAGAPTGVSGAGRALPQTVAPAAGWSWDAVGRVLEVRRSGVTAVTAVTVTLGEPAEPPSPTVSASASASASPTGQGGSSPQWSGRDIGAVGVPGSDSETGSTMSVSASGTDIWESADAFRFRSIPFTGDGTITARVISQDATDPWALAGIMLRTSADPGSPHVLLATTPAHGLSLDRRAISGGSTSYDDAGAATLPIWLRLTRAGSAVTAASSSDGVRWSTVGQVEVDLGTSILAGLAVTSHDNSRLGTARFDQVVVRDARPTDQTPPMITRVAAGAVNVNGGSITWTTDERSTSQVEYGSTERYGSATSQNSSLVTAHTVVVSGLQARTSYHYRVVSLDAAGNRAVSPDHVFTTSPTLDPELGRRQPVRGGATGAQRCVFGCR